MTTDDDVSHQVLVSWLQLSMQVKKTPEIAKVQEKKPAAAPKPAAAKAQAKSKAKLCFSSRCRDSGDNRISVSYLLLALPLTLFCASHCTNCDDNRVCVVLCIVFLVLRFD